MRKAFAIAHTTALEIVSEPLTLLTLLAALVLAVFAPTFHYHQFGEATRMARDAGFSAVFVGGGVLAVFGTLRAFRREVESGTLEMALARPISWRLFFLSKAAGAFFAASLVMATVFATALVVVEGAAVGGRIADRTGEIARVWGPCVAAGSAVIVVPLGLGAALNRLARFRFVLTAVALAAATSAVAAGWALARDARTLLPFVPAVLPLCCLTSVFTAASASLALRFRANAAATLAGLVVMAFLPFAGNYYMADALSNGGRVSWAYAGLSALAALPALAAFLVLGCREKTEGWRHDG